MSSWLSQHLSKPSYCVMLWPGQAISMFSVSFILNTYCRIMSHINIYFSEIASTHSIKRSMEGERYIPRKTRQEPSCHTCHASPEHSASKPRVYPSKWNNNLALVNAREGASVRAHVKMSQVGTHHASAHCMTLVNTATPSQQLYDSHTQEHYSS